MGASLGTITELFYRRMFEERPELLRDLFNRANQASGAQREALASAVAEVLGDAVTPAVASAWDEVYWLMANALIVMEARLYAQAQVEDGAVWQTMEITVRHEETPDAVSLVLRRADGSPTGPFVPGQYLSVRVELPDGAHQIRQYSLSSAPGLKTWRITVKREYSADGQVPEGEVSSWLHAHANPGDTLQVSLPFGDLLLPEGDSPLLLASAGIGVTPMLAMLEHLAATSPHRPVAVVHADRSPSDHAHRLELVELVGRLPHASLHVWYEDTDHPDAAADHVNEGWADIARPSPAPDATAFLCGPLAFMKAVRTDLLAHGLRPRSIHYEVFGPDLWLSK